MPGVPSLPVFLICSLAAHLALGLHLAFVPPGIKIERAAGGAAIQFASSFKSQQFQAASKQVISEVTETEPEPKPEEVTRPKDIEQIELKETQKEPEKEQASEQRKQQDALVEGQREVDQNRASQRVGRSGSQRHVSGHAEISNYRGKIVAKIRDKRRYPMGARRQRLQGKTYVSFVIDRSGSVTTVRLARSSGSSILDREALAIVSRASPFPPLPAGYTSATMALTVPILFHMR